VIAIALLGVSTLAAAEDLTMQTQRNLSLEKCLALPPAEVATRCPTVGGRLLQVDAQHVALVDKLDQRKGSLWCDLDGASWRCRRIVVVDRDLRSTRKRNPQAYITAGEILRLLSSAASVKIGEELGALFAPGDRPRTCLDLASHGCAVQGVRLRAAGPDPRTPGVLRRLWLVEDADGPMLQCSDQPLTRCDELASAGWLALLVTLRPSSVSPVRPLPELDLPELRTDKRPAPAVAVGGAEVADTPAGALDPWVKPKREKALPPTPPKQEVSKLARALDEKGRACLKNGEQATVELVLAGDGALLALEVDATPADAPLPKCLRDVARKLPLPRFAAGTYRMRAAILPKR
jgi:hypothetical protein